MRGVMKGRATRGATLEFGQYGLKSLDLAWIKAHEIEAARKVISAYTKKGGKLWIRIFPHKSVTLKPPEVRMGGGKAPVDHFVAIARPGSVLFEIAGMTRDQAREALKRAASKLSVKTTFVEEYD